MNENDTPRRRQKDRWTIRKAFRIPPTMIQREPRFGELERNALYRLIWWQRQRRWGGGFINWLLHPIAIFFLLIIPPMFPFAIVLIVVRVMSDRHRRKSTAMFGIPHQQFRDLAMAGRDCDEDAYAVWASSQTVDRALSRIILCVLLTALMMVNLYAFRKSPEAINWFQALLAMSVGWTFFMTRSAPWNTLGACARHCERDTGVFISGAGGGLLYDGAYGCVAVWILGLVIFAFSLVFLTLSVVLVPMGLVPDDFFENLYGNSIVCIGGGFAMGSLAGWMRGQHLRQYEVMFRDDIAANLRLVYARATDEEKLPLGG